MRHVLTLDDLTTEETRRVLEIAFDLKTLGSVPVNHFATLCQS